MSWETLVRMKGNAREIFGVSLALQLEDVGIMLATMTKCLLLTLRPSLLLYGNEDLLQDLW